MSSYQIIKKMIHKCVHGFDLKFTIVFQREMNKILELYHLRFIKCLILLRTQNKETLHWLEQII